MRALGTLGVVICVACAGPEAPASSERAQQPIWGGTPSLNDEAVFNLENPSSSCTATLIAPRTLLSARHCLDGPPYAALNLPNTARVDVIETLTVFEYTDGGSDHDLALLFLSAPAPVKPIPWNWWKRRYEPGRDRIRHVGYGLTETGSSGTRLQVTVPLDGTRETPIDGLGILTGDAEHGICFGDSGGPALLVPEDGGVESVLGVHTLLQRRECPWGFSTVLPPDRRFIEDWMRTHEDAGCSRDDRCVAGCTPVDQDCACVADGVCSADCIDLDDPDCSPFCKPDGLCSLGPCALRDEDCNEPGQGCLRPAQCPGRECVNDPQNPNKYCTQQCVAGLCPVGFECDAMRGVCIKQQLPYVDNGGACTDGVNLCREFSQCIDGVCTALCTSQLDCPKNWFCRESFPRICVAKNVVLRPSTLEAPAAPTGCQAIAAGPLLLMACTTIRRRARTGRSRSRTCTS